MSILNVPVTATNMPYWVRRVADAINQLIYTVDNLPTGGGGALTDGDYGDIVVSGTGTVLSFDTGVVTAFAKTFLDDANAGAVRTTLGLGTLATQSGTFSGTSSGTNTGDQTSIVGITGTKAQFDTACSDGNFVYTGDITPTSLGLGTGDSPQFTAINLGHASDTTLTRVSAGVVAIEGVNVLTTATGQPLDATLTSLAAYNTNGLLTQTAADTFTGRTLTAGNTGTTISNGNGVSGNPTITSNVWALAGTGQTATGVYDQAVDGTKANVDFVGLASFNEILIVGRGLTLSSSGSRVINLSVDNGSTFFTASGDYVSIDSAGVATNTTTIVPHSAATTAARSFFVHIINTKGAAKAIVNYNASYAQTLFVGSASDINALRVLGTAGNINGGTVRVYAR